MNKLNAISSFLVLVSGTATNFFLTPFFISTLGVEGMVVVRSALTIPMYAMLITIALLGPLSRYYVVSHKKGDIEVAAQTLSTAMISLVAFFAISTPLFAVIIAWIAREFDFGASTAQVITLFNFMFLQSAIVTFSAVLSTPSYSLNRVFVYNFSKLIVIILQTLLTVLALTYLSSDLSLVGGAFFLASLVSLMFTAYCYRKDSGEVTIARRNYSWSVLRKLVDLGRWTMVDNFGVFFLLSFDLFFVAFLLGQLEAGRYAIYLQLVVAIITVSKALIIIYGPRILSLYAEEQHCKLYDFYCYTIRQVAFMCAAISGTFYVYATEFIDLWLGDEFITDARLYSIYIVILGFTLTTTTASYLFSAYCKVKTPALLSLVTGVLHPVLSYILAVAMELGIEGFMASMVIVFAAKNVLFVTLYVSTLTKESIYRSAYSTLLYVPLVILFIASANFSKTMFPVFTFVDFTLSLGVVCGILGILAIMMKKIKLV